MPEYLNTVSDFGNVREAVCISARKIMDACRDQDCMENLPVYLTAGSQEALENATSVKARSAELLYVDVDWEPVPYQEGYFCLDIRYFYRIIADATIGGVRPVAIYGLATASRQAMLYGGEGSAQTFTSEGGIPQAQPVGVVEAVDPVILCSRVAERCNRPCPPGSIPGQLPDRVAAAFDDAIPFQEPELQLQVTLGQFSLVRLERDTQLLIPSYNYCVPEKGCSEGDCGCAEDPCEAFSRMQFPVGEFFPTGDCTVLRDDQDCGCCNNGSGGNGGSNSNGGNGGSEGPRPGGHRR